MKAVKCPYCGGPTKKNGRTSSGAQRWRCGASTTVRYDDSAARLEEFLSWLLSKGTQLEMPGAGRTFRRRTSAQIIFNVVPLCLQHDQIAELPAETITCDALS